MVTIVFPEKSVGASRIADYLSPDDHEGIKAWGEQSAIEAQTDPDFDVEDPRWELHYASLRQIQHRNRVWIPLSAEGDIAVAVDWYPHGHAMIYIYEDSCGDFPDLENWGNEYNQSFMHNSRDLPLLIAALQRAEQVIAEFRAAYIAAGGVVKP